MTQDGALKILKTGANVFLTGEPGSGKTHTINRYVEYLRSHKIEPSITASTGIASTHIGGTTIHSWSGIGIKNQLNKFELNKIATNDYVKKRVGKAKILIIDEISMLPIETLNLVDRVLRKVKENSKPFGGIQVVLVGDFFQLPPVIKRSKNEYAEELPFNEESSRFAFDSPIWREADFLTCYIKEQYRQIDDVLLQILAKIRSNSFDKPSLAQILQRKFDIQNVPPNAPKLFSHNIDVDIINDQMLGKIEAKRRLFKMEATGHEAIINSMKKGCLSPENLYLKIGAQVMFTKNDQKNGFVNGTLGEVVKFDELLDLPVVKTRSGRKIVVSRYEWTVEENGKVRGQITQIPLRLAWAITVHKSQGISLDEAVVNLSKVFEFGQGYVALSRVRCLSGIYILGWNNMAFQVSEEVLEKDREFQTQSIETEKMLSHFSDERLSKITNDFIVICGGDLNISTLTNKKSMKRSYTYNETLKINSSFGGSK